MAKLINVYRSDKQPLNRRQLPLAVDDNLTMVMDLNGVPFVYDNDKNSNSKTVVGDFMEKYIALTQEELHMACRVPLKDILSVLSQTVSCVGCRRSVERLFYQLMKSSHRALDPLIITPEGTVTVHASYLEWPYHLFTLMQGHSSSRLSNLIENHSRSKKSKRCALHSLDSQRTRSLTSWQDTWAILHPKCREEVVVIDSNSLVNTLENYLQKHRFCGECRTKVLKAYSLLIDDPDPNKEKGYVPALYSGIKRCSPDKHIHLTAKTEFINNLISRAEPELNGSRRERHAKTLEIAQEEVLICLGICIYERLHRIQLRLKEEECTCQVLTAIAIDGICRNFELAIEYKRGISQLEILYDEITKEEQLKQQRREHKRLRRRKRKDKKAEEKENFDDHESEEANEPACEHVDDDCSCFEDKPMPQHVDRQKLQVLHRKAKGTTVCNCVDCEQKNNKDNISTTKLYPLKNLPAVESHSDSSDNVKISPNKSMRSQQKRKGEQKSFADSSGSDNSFNGKIYDKKKSVVTNQKLKDNVEHKNTDESLFSLCQSCVNVHDILDDQDNKDSVWSVISNNQSQDCGYSSENNTCTCSASSPDGSDGSEVACSEGFCNHEGDCQSEAGLKEHNHYLLRSNSSNFLSTLEQMLEGSCSCEGEEESYIPFEVVQEFKNNHPQIKEHRNELRQRLRDSFNNFCISHKRTSCNLNTLCVLKD